MQSKSESELLSSPINILAYSLSDKGGEYSKDYNGRILKNLLSLEKTPLSALIQPEKELSLFANILADFLSDEGGEYSDQCGDPRDSSNLSNLSDSSDPIKDPTPAIKMIGTD
jgi:hypothetical protein